MNILDREEYNELIISFKEGIHHYNIPEVSVFKDTLSQQGLTFWKWFMGQNNYGGNADETFDDLEIKLGRIPTYHEFVEANFKSIKTSEWAVNKGIEWDSEKEECVKVRVGWWYTSHITELLTLSQLSLLYPDSKSWTDPLVDRVFGTDIVFEDSETGCNFYLHITKHGNSIMSKQDRGFCKDVDGKWHKFKRDFSADLGHMELLYDRQTGRTTKYIGSQPVFRKDYLERKIESLRAVSIFNDFDDTVTPAELDRFNQFVQDNNIV